MIKKKKFLLEVVYPSHLYYQMPYLDEDIRKAVKRSICNSGMGFGVRDLYWSFQKKEDAEKAKLRIRTVLTKMKRAYPSEAKNLYSTCKVEIVPV